MTDPGVVAHDALKAYSATYRDRFAVWLADGVLKVFATREYRDVVNAIIRAGLIEAVKRAPNPPFADPMDDD